MLVDEVHDVLREAGVEHALIGAAALLAHGLSRASLDIDLLVTDDKVLEAGFWSPRGLRALCRRGGAFDPLAGTVRVTRDGEIPVDLVLFGPHGWQQQALSRAAGTSIPVVTLEDLVRLKLFAGGPRDRADVHGLLDLHPHLATLRVPELPDRCRALWTRLLAERAEP